MTGIGPSKVAALVLTYNDIELTKKCIKSVLSSSYEGLQVFLIDNGSDFDCLSPVIQLYSNVHPIKCVAPSGYSGGFNSGIKYLFNNNIPFDYVLIVTNDLEIEPTTLSMLVNIMDQNKDIGFLGPETFKRDGSGDHDQWITALFDNDNPADIKLINDTDIDNLKKIEVEFVVGHCMLVRKEVIKDVGLIRDFFIYWEEREWQWRAKLRGWKTYVVPKSLCYHDRDSFGNPFNAYMRTRNLIFFNRLVLMKESKFKKHFLKNLTKILKWGLAMLIRRKWGHQHLIKFIMGFKDGLFSKIPDYEKI